MAFSREYHKIVRTAKCPTCKRFNLLNHFVDTNSGLPVSFGVWNFTKFTAWQCSKCGARVQVIAREGLPSDSGIKVTGVFEMTRSEEAIGSERRLIDNSASSVDVSRRFSLTKECARTYRVEKEIASSYKLSLGISEALTWPAETELRRRYSISDSQRLTHQEEVTINVPKGIKVSVVFQWKLIWQHGSVKLVDSIGQEFSVPFKISQELTFDQTQEDEV